MQAIILSRRFSIVLRSGKRLDNSSTSQYDDKIAVRTSVDHCCSTRNTDANNSVSIHCLALLMAVLFAGSVVCPRTYIRTVFGNVVREDLSSRFYRAAVRAIRMSDFPRVPSIQSFTAFLIVDATWLRAEQPLICCSFVGLAVSCLNLSNAYTSP